MSDIVFLMALRNRSKRAFKSIKSIIDSGLGTNFDFLIIQDEADDNLCYADFEDIPSSSYGKMMIKNVKIGGMFHKTLLLNHGIRISDHKFIIQHDADILFNETFLKALLHVCSNEDDFNRHIFFAPYVEERDMVDEVVHINWPPRKKGDETGKTFFLYRPQVEEIRGYDERMRIWNEEYDLANRLKGQFGLTEFSLEKFGIKNIHMTHENNIRSNCTAEMNARNGQITMDNLMRGNFTVNDEDWGIIKNES